VNRFSRHPAANVRLSAEIDAEVYALFSLTADEIALIQRA